MKLTTHIYTYTNIDNPKVFLESMTNKHHSSVNEEEELEVAGLESGEVFRANHSIKITRLNARELCHIVNNLTGKNCIYNIGRFALVSSLVNTGSNCSKTVTIYMIVCKGLCTKVCKIVDSIKHYIPVY